MYEDQRLYRIHHPYSHYLARPLARKCLPLAIRWRLKPNQVTVAAAGTLLAGLALFGVGGFVPRILAACAIVVSHFLDCIDGELARRTGQTSKRGEYLDALGGYVRGGLLLPAIGLGLTLVPDAGHALLKAVLPIPVGAYVSIGLWAGCATSLVRVINLRYRSLLGRSLRGVKHGFLQIASVPHGLVNPLLLAAAGAQALSVLLIAYSLYHTLELLYGLYKSVRA